MFQYMDYAYAVYKEKSFTKAAKELCISQPALSATIRKLEKSLGHPIFDRSGKTITLTDIGERYIRSVEQIMLIRQNLQQELEDLVDLKRGSMILGGTTYIISDVLPALLKEFGRRYPDLELKIQVEPSTLLWEKMDKGLVDIAIDNALVQDPDHQYLPLFQEHILIGVPADSPINEKLKAYQLDQAVLQERNYDFSGMPKVNVAEFAKEDFILLKTGNKMRQIAHNFFTDTGINPHVRFEFDQLSTSISFAEAGFGVCFLTDTILKHSGPSKNLVLYQPDTRYTERNLYIMYKKNKYLSAAARAFIDILQEYFG